MVLGECSPLLLSPVFVPDLPPALHLSPCHLLLAFPLIPLFLISFSSQSADAIGVFFAHFCPCKITENMLVIRAITDKLRSNVGSQLWGDSQRMYGLSRCEKGYSGASMWPMIFRPFRLNESRMGRNLWVFSNRDISVCLSDE